MGSKRHARRHECTLPGDVYEPTCRKATKQQRKKLLEKKSQKNNESTTPNPAFPEGGKEFSKPLPPELPYVCKAAAAYGWNAAAGADVTRGDLLFEAGAAI